MAVDFKALGEQLLECGMSKSDVATEILRLAKQECGGAPPATSKPTAAPTATEATKATKAAKVDANKAAMPCPEVGTTFKVRVIAAKVNSGGKPYLTAVIDDGPLSGRSIFGNVA